MHRLIIVSSIVMITMLFYSLATEVRLLKNENSQLKIEINNLTYERDQCRKLWIGK